MLLASMQNITNAPSDRMTHSGWSARPENRSGATTKKFLTHCGGRTSWIQSRTVALPAAGGAARAAGFSCEVDLEVVSGVVPIVLGRAEDFRGRVVPGWRPLRAIGVPCSVRILP
jgi:hypothetical protein